MNMAFKSVFRADFLSGTWFVVHKRMRVFDILFLLHSDVLLNIGRRRSAIKRFWVKEMAGFMKV